MTRVPKRTTAAHLRPQTEVVEAARVIVAKGEQMSSIPECKGIVARAGIGAVCKQSAPGSRPRARGGQEESARNRRGVAPRRRPSTFLKSCQAKPGACVWAASRSSPWTSVEAR